MKIVFRCLPQLEAILPAPVPAKRGLPDWLKRMPMTARAEDFDTEVKTVKQCPPFVDAMSFGFLMPLACDLRFEDGAFAWDWDDLPAALPRHTVRAPLSFHLNAQVVDSPLFEADSLLIKFMNFWTIELEPGQPTGPALSNGHGSGRRRSLRRQLCALPGGVDRPRFLRRSSEGHAGGPVRPGAAPGPATRSGDA